MQKIKHSLVWVLTTSLVVIAVVLVVFRFDLLGAAEYKRELEILISEEVGLPVTIGKLAAKVEGISPQIRLINVQIDGLGKNLPAIHIGEIDLEIRLIDSLLNRQFIPERIIIANTAISVKRFKDGHIELAGLPVYDPTIKNDKATGDFSWLLEGSDIQIIDSQVLWVDETRDVDDLLLTKAAIILRNSGQSHQLDITASLANQVSEPFRLSLTASGDLLSSDEWTATAYLKTDGVQLATILDRFSNGAFSSSTGSAGVEAWLERV